MTLLIPGYGIAAYFVFPETFLLYPFIIFNQVGKCIFFSIAIFNAQNLHALKKTKEKEGRFFELNPESYMKNFRGSGRHSLLLSLFRGFCKVSAVHELVGYSIGPTTLFGIFFVFNTVVVSHIRVRRVYQFIAHHNIVFVPYLYRR